MNDVIGWFCYCDSVIKADSKIKEKTRVKILVSIVRHKSCHVIVHEIKRSSAALQTDNDRVEVHQG